MSKTVTGAGYLLMIIGLLVEVAGAFAVSPYAAIGGSILMIIGFLLVNIGFIIMGRKYGKGAWTATGVIGIIVFILAIAAIALISHTILSALAQIEAGGAGEGLYNALAGALGMIGIAGILAFVWIIMEIVVLWSAAGYFGSGTLKAAAILKIIVLIITIIGIPALVIGAGLGALSGGAEGIIAMSITALAILGLDILFAIISLILAGIGFLTAKEPTAYAPQAYSTQVAPPPPPQ